MGDAWLEKQKVNARLRFEQSHIRTDFFFYVFNFFSFYSPNTPKLRSFHWNTGKTYNTWHFTTLSLPYFTYYYNLFYDNGIKRIPSNIYDLLTPTVLAFWIMSDGFKYNKNVGITTNSFTIADCHLLCSV